MATYQFTATIQRKNLREQGAEKIRHRLAAMAATHVSPDVSFGPVRKVDTKTPSRADRLATALDSINDGLSEIECLREELQSWYDNLPENLQGADTGCRLEEAASILEEVHSEIENGVSTADGVEFPGMFG